MAAPWVQEVNSTKTTARYCCCPCASASVRCLLRFAMRRIVRSCSTGAISCQFGMRESVWLARTTTHAIRVDDDRPELIEAHARPTDLERLPGLGRIGDRERRLRRWRILRAHGWSIRRLIVGLAKEVHGALDFVDIKAALLGNRGDQIGELVECGA